MIKKESGNMKKIIIVLMAMISSIILFSGCNKKLTGYTEISYSEFNKLKEENKTFPLVIGSATCSACLMYKPVMEQFISDYQVEVFYIDLSKLSDEDYGKLKAEITFDGTPTTVFYEDGKLTSFYDRITSAVSIDEVISKFKEKNYIK